MSEEASYICFIAAARLLHLLHINEVSLLIKSAIELLPKRICNDEKCTSKQWVPRECGRGMKISYMIFIEALSSRLGILV